MEYTPVTAVWEITMGCNMRCGHCGSSCKDALPDELSTEEALRVCDEMKALGMRWITLSGGEPLTRKDWPLIAGRLYRNGIIPNIITNGWLVNDKMVEDAEANGVETISISLDGVEKTHDKIRKKGSYRKVIDAFRVLKKYRHTSAANTTVTKENIDQLDAIKAVLLENEVDLWQLQIGLPMGNLAEKRELVIDKASVDYLLDFSYRTTIEGKIKVFPADCLGYYTGNEGIVRQISIGTTSPVVWQGCNAGKRSFGLLHNGDVLGCTSIREPSLIEGNIRKRSLVEIWNDSEAFKWSREMKKSDLAGDCRICAYGDVCLGGCPNTRLTLNNSLYSDNEYCSYHHAMDATRVNLKKYTDVDELSEVAWVYVRSEKWQLAELTLERLLAIAPDNEDALALYGFVSFSLGNFVTAKEANEKILRRKPDDTYALKGLGVTLHKMGESDKGIHHLKRALKHTDADSMDAYFDLSVVYEEMGEFDKALNILNQGEQKSPGFLARVEPFYNRLLSCVTSQQQS